MMLDRYAEATDVLQRLVDTHARDPYVVLTYAICMHWMGDGEEADERVASQAENLEPDAWIAPVVCFYAGEITEAEVLEKTEAEDSQLSNDRKCEAYYYLGMAQLLGIPAGVQPDTTAAMGYFEKCVATGVEAFVEFKLARRMLESR